jgi:hypothetical protein
MPDKMPSRGFQGAVLKLLRAADYRLTVTGRRELTPHYLRLSFDGGGLLTDRPLHPTMWIRMWFADGGKAASARLHLGWRATTELPARWPRSSARTTRSRANRLRLKPIGWHEGSATRSARRTPRALRAHLRRRVQGTRTGRSSLAPASEPGGPPTRGRQVPAR